MKRSIVVLGLLSIGVVSFQVVSGATGQAGGGWTTLFDGSSLEGWNVLGNANWELADGAVQADSGSGFLVTEDSYADFELALEFWVDEPANSGVFMRCADPQDIRDTNCYEANIFDTRPDQTYRTGGIVHVGQPMSVINAGGRWNTYEIVAQASAAKLRNALTSASSNSSTCIKPRGTKERISSTLTSTSRSA